MSKDKSKEKTPKEQDASTEQGALETKGNSSEEKTKEKKPVEKKAEPAPAQPALGKEDTHRVLCSSITSRRGVLVKDQGCRANDFPGGDAQLDEMVAKKLIKKA